MHQGRLKVLSVQETPTVQVVVEARGQKVPGLYLHATPEQCTLGFAGSEILECHRDAGLVDGLVDLIVMLTERYLSGTIEVAAPIVRNHTVRIET